MTVSESDDHVLRAITDNAAFRVITVRTTSTVRGVLAAQKARGAGVRILADLVTGAVLVRESMAPDLRVQCILQIGGDAAARARVIADAHPDGSARGLLQLAAGEREIALGADARLQVARTLHNGALQQGVVSVSESGGVSGALMRYMQLSEQVVTMVAVGCYLDGDEVIAAGGYLVQLLPELAEGPLMVMTERLKDFATIDPLLAEGSASPEELLSELLYGMPFTEVGGRRIHYACLCDQARLAAALATLPTHEIEHFVSDGRILDIACEYCGKNYQFAPEQLRGMLQKS